MYKKKSSSRPTGSSSKISVKVQEKKSGTVLLQVAGRWLEKDKPLDTRQLKAFEFFRAMERSPYYGLGTPAISGNAIRFSVAAEAEKIKLLLNGLKQLNIPYKVNKLDRLRAKSESLLDELTLRQTRVLRLAHAMGYYDIPRRTNTEDLARTLEMYKATVGEHLRRAEKHVFDKLLV